MEQDETGRASGADAEKVRRQRRRFVGELDDELRFVTTPAEQVDDLLLRLGLGGERP